MEEVKGIYHTHTKYSKFHHGKNTVDEMICSANKLQLKEYAITDHGSRHIFGICSKNIPILKKQIKDAQKTSNAKLLMGLEFNLLGKNGETDFNEKFADCFDIKLLGAHKAGVVNLKNFFTFLLPNVFKHNNKKTIEMNTDAYINALKKHGFDIITHPNDFLRINPKRLATACVENNCYIELNEKHMSLSESDVSEMLETEVQFIIGSDAHKVCRIGEVSKILEFIKKCNIPEDRVCNLNKLPNFKNKYTKEEN